MREGTVMEHEHDIEISSVYDVEYCPTCDIWLEDQCKCGPETNCIFSVSVAGPLPAKPSEVHNG